MLKNYNTYYSNRIEKILIYIVFVILSASPAYANKFLDSLYLEFKYVKTDTSKYNLLYKIINEYVETGSENFNPNAITSLLDSTIEQLRIKKDIYRFELFLSLKSKLCFFNKKYDLGLLYCDTCISIAEKLRNFNALGNLFLLKCWFYVTLNLNERRVQSIYKAIDYYKKAGNLQGEAEILFTLGNIYSANQQFDLSIKTFLSSAVINRKLKDSIEEGMSFLFCGVNALKMGNLKLAEEYIIKGKPVINSPLVYQPFYYYLTYGKWLKAMNRNAEALKIFEIAAKLSIKGNQRYQKPSALCEMAEIYINENKFGKAKHILDEAINIAYDENILSIKILVIKVFAKYYESIGNTGMALKEYKVWQALKDSANQNELSRALTSSVMEAEYNKKDAERAAEQQKRDKVEEQKLRNQKLIAYATGIVLLFVGFIAFLLFRNNRQQKMANAIITSEKQHSDALLNNILPQEVASELKATGLSKAKDFSEVTVLFTDFKDFTSICEQLTAQQLVDEINYYYSAFDNIITKYNIEKIKTIGDSYMCVGGLPVKNETNSYDSVLAALELRDFMLEEKQKRIEAGLPYLEIRIGLHSGPVVAGIVGIKKFAYDIWGDTVNIASRMENKGEPGKVNISGRTFELVKDKFDCYYRGKIQAKHKGEIDMYFVEHKINS